MNTTNKHPKGLYLIFATSTAERFSYYGMRAIFYMGVNVGSFLAPLVCGYFGETGNPQDFKWGFLIAAIVTVLTVVLFETQKNRYLIGPDGQQLGIVPDARKETEGTLRPASSSRPAS